MGVTSNNLPLTEREQSIARWHDSLRVGNYEMVQIGTYFVVVEGIDRIKQFSVQLKNRNNYAIEMSHIQKCLTFILGEPKREFADIAGVLEQISTQLENNKVAKNG